MLQVFGRPTSINVRKVLLVCAELELDCSNEPWGTEALSTHAPEFLALNPNALIPVLRDGEFVLWESNTICRYLAAREQRADLWPTVLQSRAIVDQWMDWQAGDLNFSWRYAYMGLMRNSAAHADPALIQASVEQWTRMMTILDAQLARTGAYVAGSSFTLADVVIGLAVNRWFMTSIERPRLAAVDAYFERLKQRPAFLKHGANGMP